MENQIPKSAVKYRDIPSDTITRSRAEYVCFREEGEESPAIMSWTEVYEQNGEGNHVYTRVINPSMSCYKERYEFLKSANQDRGAA